MAYIPRRGISGSYGHSCLTLRNCYIILESCCTISHSNQHCIWLLIDPLVFIWLFYCSHPSRCELVSHCDFDFHFLEAFWTPSHVFSGYLYIFLGERSIQDFCPFLIVFLVFGLRCKIPLYIMDTCPLLCIWFAKIFYHTIGCLFTLFSCCYLFIFLTGV